ncbi:MULTISPECIES: hypothetical protein [Neobacillus]|jgi:hypothetical protein|uniref:Uncharacterized protein n=2 Tax=Neobacillus TaxID=2675232 RepID=A0A6B3TNI2_9BACI|nr:MULTISPECIES: hypothetical protein [Neobacillus]AIM16136.1 hypothetical protein HW35_07375 [Bacillus sp. X1(2014)]MCD4837917.1 hypothetical protein [Neobacillus sedimentimangrovi]MED3622514.1 hypothetical protein [Neobacillus thermocopriae]MED3714005.1 hypothetical protein [Neobacillus thermocopriae]NEX77337.1 hypothetical protein [Neobacillus thermocopriae]
MGPTLDTWIWVIYYGFFFITFIAAIVASVENLIKRRYSVMTILLIPIFIVMVALNSMNRLDQNEWEYWLTSLLRGELWSWICLLMILYIFFWWMLMIQWRFNKKDKEIKNRSM